MKCTKMMVILALFGMAWSTVAANGRELNQAPTVTVDSPQSLPTIAAPTVKFAYKDGVGAFQGWNGGLELPKTIDLGGVRVTRPILRGRKLNQAPTVTVDSPQSLPTIAAPTVKFAYKDGVGAFQGWNGGLELPKTIDLGGVRVTRPILRGRKLNQAPTVTVDSPQSLPTIAAPTVKFAYKDGVGAFQGWNGGLELPKTIDLGGVRVTRPILRGRKLNQAPTVTVDSPQSLPTIAAPTVKFAYKDGVGAFQGWNGGLELPKTIDLGGVRVTRPILRGRKLNQAPTVTVDSPQSLPTIAAPTVKFAYKDGVGAFQGWNGGLELPKTIDLGGVRVTRPILRGRKH